jgi:hypothetical protein
MHTIFVRLYLAELFEDKSLMIHFFFISSLIKRCNIWRQSLIFFICIFSCYGFFDVYHLIDDVPECSTEPKDLSIQGQLKKGKLYGFIPWNTHGYWWCSSFFEDINVHLNEYWGSNMTLSWSWKPHTLTQSVPEGILSILKKYHKEAWLLWQPIKVQEYEGDLKSTSLYFQFPSISKKFEMKADDFSGNLLGFVFQIKKVHIQDDHLNISGPIKISWNL